MKGASVILPGRQEVEAAHLDGRVSEAAACSRCSDRSSRASSTVREWVSACAAGLKQLRGWAVSAFPSHLRAPPHGSALCAPASFNTRRPTPRGTSHSRPIHTRATCTSAPSWWVDARTQQKKTCTFPRSVKAPRAWCCTRRRHAQMCGNDGACRSERRLQGSERARSRASISSNIHFSYFASLFWSQKPTFVTFMSHNHV